MSADATDAQYGYDRTKLANLYGHDSSVGKMLQQLYGKPKYKLPELSLKTRPMAGPQPNMVAVNAKPSAVDPRAKTINRTAIAEVEANKPPAVIVKEKHVAPIELRHGSIRSKSLIDRRLQESERTGDLPQIPIRPGRNAEMEKRKLELTFALKGGHALPEAGLPEALVGPVPMQLLTGKPGPGASASARRGSTSRVEGARKALSSPLYEELKLTYTELSKGLNEARAYWDEVKCLQGGVLRASQAQEAAAEEDGRNAQLRRLLQDMKAEQERLQKGL